MEGLILVTNLNFPAQLLISRLTGHVDSSTHFGGYGVNQAVTYRRAERRAAFWRGFGH